MITSDMLFRETGDCSQETFEKVLKDAKSPITPAQACYDMIKGMSALALSQTIKESSCGTTQSARKTKNPLGLFDYTAGARVEMIGGMPFMVFDRWEDAFQEWMRRMKDPKYKNGVYPADCTLKQFIYTYVGGPECWSSKGARCANGETRDSVELYLKQTIERIDRYKEERLAITYGKVPKPKWTERLIPDSQNSAWDNLGPRLMRGIVYHRQVGTNWGTDGWFRMMWQSNGQKGGGQMGLTDFGVDCKNGETLRWNDHTGKAWPALGVSANRAGWASGPWERASDVGAKFVNAYGANAINRDLISIEIDGMYEDPVLAPAREQIAQLSAWLADQAKVAWTNYPINPHTGLTFVYEHGNFQGHKACCGRAVRNTMPEIIARTKEILKQHQESGNQEEQMDKSFDNETLSWMFGTAVGDDGVTYKFTPAGSVTKLWLERSNKLALYPRLAGVRVFGVNSGNERKVFLFADGSVIDWTSKSGAKFIGV